MIGFIGLSHLGLNYALEQSYAAMDPGNNPRTFDGYYVQS